MADDYICLPEKQLPDDLSVQDQTILIPYFTENLFSDAVGQKIDNGKQNTVDPPRFDRQDSLPIKIHLLETLIPVCQDSPINLRVGDIQAGIVKDNLRTATANWWNRIV